MEYPPVSVVTVNYNGERYLRKCFRSIAFQDYPKDRMRVIVVDNRSQDGSTGFLKQAFPDVEIIDSGANLGYSGGGNLGYGRASGDYVVFMANDMIFPGDWVRKMVEFMEIRPEAAVATTLMVNGESTEGMEGEMVNASPVLTGRSDTVGSGCTVVPWGGACIIRRSLFRLPFDSDYFIYGEDVYLGLLSWLKGFRVVANTGTSVAHMGSVIVGFFSRDQVHYNERNRLTNLVLFFRKSTLAMLLPLVMTDLIVKFFHFIAIGRFDLVKAEAEAVWWNIANLRRNLGKRRAVQAERKVGDGVILGALCENVYGKGGLKDVANALMTAYFRFVKGVCTKFSV